MWNKLKELFKAKEAIDTTIPENKPKTNKPKEPKKQVELTPKQKATAAGEPYVDILKVDLDPNDLNNGAFELDWNDKFIINLIKSGYKIREDDSDQNIVDRWFQNVCRNVALEIYEQDQADPTNRDMRVVRSRDIGDGRTEVS
jgi:hypothetical protein